MKKFDEFGLMLCEMQAELFVASLNFSNSSLEFIKAFMNSETARELDDYSYLSHSSNLIDDFKDKNIRGSYKLDADVLYWIGYIYRYWSYTYEISSKEIYKIIQGKELSSLFEPYHTLDCSIAIKRIYEDKNINPIKNQLDILKKIYGFKS